MGNKKEIGQAFKEKLNQLDRLPNDSLWEAIELDLNKKKSKRRIILIPLWLKSIGILALFAVFSWYTIHNLEDNSLLPTSSNETTTIKKPSNNSYNKKDKHSTTTKTKTTNISDQLNQNNSEIYNPKFVLTNTISTSNFSLFQQITQRHFFTFNKPFDKSISKNHYTSVLKKPEKEVVLKHNKKQINAIYKKSIQENVSIKVSVAAGLEKEFTITDYSKLVLEKDSLNSKNDSLKTKTLEKFKIQSIQKDSIEPKLFNSNKIYVFVYYSPTYTGLFSDNSPIDKRLNQNSITSNITPCYGLYLGYQATEKWSFRIGYNLTNTQLTTENALINTPDYTNIEYSQNYSNASIYSQSNYATTMSITQDISYSELPIEIQYIISNNKFGFNVFSGFGFRLLKNNIVKVETNNGYEFTIGETKYLSNSTIDFILGFGIDYKFSKKIKLNFEPVFKYHFMDYENYSSIKPYTIGIQTGIQFNF